MFLKQPDNNDRAQIHRILSTHTKILSKFVLPPILASLKSLGHDITSLDDTRPASPKSLPDLHALPIEHNSIGKVEQEIEEAQAFESLHRGRSGHDAKWCRESCRSLLTAVLDACEGVGIDEVRWVRKIPTVRTWLHGNDAEVAVLMDVLVNLGRDLALKSN